MDRENYSSGAPWEAMVGYSRAVRVGRTLHVTGSTGIDESGAVVDPKDADAQAARTLENIERALAAFGAGFEHDVRTRMYVTDIERWEQVGRAHREVFHEVRPATTMVEASRLIDPERLVEIEAGGVLP